MHRAFVSSVSVAAILTFLAGSNAGGALGHPTSARSHSQRITGLKGHILFTRAGGRYGDETVFVANADGTGQRRVSPVGSSGSPWATRNGSRIVFGGRAPDGRFTAVTAKLDGSDRVLLPLPKGTLNLGDGPFSPDGKRLVREGFDDLHHASDGIYITRASDGANPRHITKQHFIPGDFSPNGKQLVLFRGPEGEPPPPGALWIVNANGRGLRRLTGSNVKVACCFNYRWSPNGKKILFADFDGVIWTIAPDGSKRTKVFKDDKGRYAATPTLSPDGSMIMFALDPTPNPFEHPLNGLYVIDAGGSGLTQVIGGNDFKREPVWVNR